MADRPIMQRTFLTNLRNDLTGWLGIIGLAMNLISAFEPFLILSHWAQVLIRNWIYWTSNIWVDLLGLIGIRIPPLVGFSLSLSLFNLMLAVSATAITRPSLWSNFGNQRISKTDVEVGAEKRKALAAFLYSPIFFCAVGLAINQLERNISQLPKNVEALYLTGGAVAIIVSIVVMFVTAQPSRLVRRLANVYIVGVLILLLAYATVLLPI
jgi:hypothetical protein